MKLLMLVTEFLDNSVKKTPMDLSLANRFLCDDCYKVVAKTSLSFPNTCLLAIEDFELILDQDGIVLLILKAKVKSTKIQDFSRFLCIIDHHPQVIQSLKKFRYSNIANSLNSESSQFNIEAQFIQKNPLPIGFSMKSTDKSLEFSKQRKSLSKVLQSQDDILTALLPQNANPHFIRPEPEKNRVKPREDKKKSESLADKNEAKTENVAEENKEIQEFPTFPDWALCFLSYYLSNNGFVVLRICCGQLAGAQAY